MATSGTTTFAPTVQDIITSALEIVNAIESGENASGADEATALRHLNFMLKAWARDGIHLWAQDDAALFLEEGVAEYGLTRMTPAYVQTTLSADEATGQTTLSVTSTVGMTAADNIGIRLDDGTLQWTTISTTAPLVVANALTGDAAAGALVFAYTSAVSRPIQLYDARRLDAASGVETPLEMVGRMDYMRQSNKTTQGQPTTVYYEPTIGGGRVYVWPAPDSTATILKFTGRRPIQDAGTLGDNLELPPEWMETAVNSLAGRLALPFQVPLQRAQVITALAKSTYAAARAANQDPASVFIRPRVR